MPFIKIGQKGSFVDNGGAGGILAQIDPKNGTIITDGKDEAYCIQRNHFYSLGTKTKSEPDDGKEPDEEDDKDTDDPLDINTNAGVEYLLLKINDAWDGNHDLIYKEE